MTHKYPSLLKSLNQGDAGSFANVLLKEGYYTQDEAKYAASMKSRKNYLDATLGSK